MTCRSVRALVGAVGIFAIARGLGALSPTLQLIAAVFHERADVTLAMDWITAFGVVSCLILMGVGVLLLLRPPTALLALLCSSDSSARRLRGVVGILLGVLAIEQIHRYSLMLERLTRGPLYIVSVAMRILLLVSALFLVPVGVAAAGAVLALRARAGRPLGCERESETGHGQHVEPAEIWSVAAALAGAFVLALALPSLPAIIDFILFNASPRPLGGDKTWLIFAGGSKLLAFSLEVAVGLYLLGGAPHLVRWHVARMGPAPGEAA